MTEGSPPLAERLRSLRKEAWPEVQITQKQLADAFGLSTGLLSSWENAAKPTLPPPRRLESYATFFATIRSTEGDRCRVLPLAELNEAERQAREKLLKELRHLRDGVEETDAAAPKPGLVPPPDHLWQFPEGQDVIIVCARLPPYLLDHPYANPESADYVELYTYADLDSLIELYGHIRACNPTNRVTFRTTDERNRLKRDEYNSHLILLGGVDWNVQTRQLLDWVNLPVRQVERDGDSGPLGGFEVTHPDGSTGFFSARLDDDGHLLSDVAHLYHGANPFNRKRTVTVCNGTFGRGTYGVVRALTDRLFWDRNQGWLNTRFGGAESFSLISRVPVFNSPGLTPDWTLAANRLHEWPETSTA
ncbi:helix-turn-helix transcriptional regulator [Amycolatopsis sp. PS_44_ISF1]|uniref:helix-turn-helix domain-containing protein n=1 Tax=Amycolatopsis sp. PS_44_ISF1 TaxID=2974917 RepID=UPI0028DEFB2B|nr:helix-turn-helix transcriptional regulator [Amycolatopsis sp. PS_44_ISF1]MDT8913990.1 helix-turn-helix domain-containing protein [Amycolatopsis sp. PS_44_ISF1]